MNKDLKQPRGQALIIIALAMVGLVSFAALAIDGGMVFSDRRHAQNAADTAAFAAALTKLRTPDTDHISFKDAGKARAASNGYNNDGVSNTVEVHSPPISGPYVNDINKNDYVQVIITSRVKTTFARIVGRTQVTNVVEAIARAKPLGPVFGGAAMVSLRTDGKGFIGNGNLNLNIKKGGLYVNSPDACALDVFGNGSLTVDDGAFSVVGGRCGNVNITPLQTGVPPISAPNISFPTPDVTCSGNGWVDTNTKTVHPGNFAGKFNIPGNGNYTFAPGNYCFNNGAVINGNLNLTANDVNFRINAGDFSITGNSVFTSCSNFLVYSAGGSGISFNGNGNNNCTGVTFYMETGTVSWNGNVANTFTAQTSGPYKNLLIYLPQGNTSPLTINGNSGNQLTGAIYAFSSSITINGNSGTTGFQTQIIGYDITLSGNSNTVINYLPDLLPPDPATIGLIK